MLNPEASKAKTSTCPHPQDDPTIKLVKSSSLAASADIAVLLRMTVTAGDQIVGQIQRIGGATMIGQGARYVTTQKGMLLRLHDRVVVLAGIIATLAFSNGCQLRDARLRASHDRQSFSLR